MGNQLKAGQVFMPLAPNGGILGLPADFLVAPDGTLRAAHYGAVACIKLHLAQRR